MNQGRILPEALQSLHGQRILVTGAAGFIGGALFRQLAGYGLDVTGTVLLPAEAEALRAEGFTARVLDLASDEPFEPHVEGMDLVFNIAAMFQETEHGEAMFEKVNNEGALKLCKAAAAVGVTRFVQCSTVGVHGHVQEMPCRETSPYNPMDHYHRTKLNGELAILEFARTLPADGMIVTVNRPSMVYGPGDLRMMKLFRSILAGRFVMIGSGEVLAHLGYIDDQTESFLLQAVAPREKVHLEAFNIASDEPVSLNRLAGLIAAEGDVTLPRFRVPVGPVWFAGLVCEILWSPFNARPPLFRRRVGFFTHNRAFDLSKAAAHFGYRSNWSTEDGVRERIAWYKEQDLV